MLQCCFAVVEVVIQLQKIGSFVAKLCKIKQKF